MALNSWIDLIADIDSKKTTVEEVVGLEKCAACSIPLQESVTGCRKIDDGSPHGCHLCSDCYFKGLGNEIEDFPILPPRLRRRA